MVRLSGLLAVRAMLHDEVVYPDPSTFKPERFLTRDGRLDPNVRDPSLIAFGFGRRFVSCVFSTELSIIPLLFTCRICPGSHVALSMLWLWAASFLATYSISPAVDEEGASVEPSIEYESSSITLCVDFFVHFWIKIIDIFLRIVAILYLSSALSSLDQTSQRS